MNTDKITPIATLLIPIFNKKFEDYGSYLETEISDAEIRSILTNEGYCDSIIKDYLDHRSELEAAKLHVDASIKSSLMSLHPLRLRVQEATMVKGCP